MNKTAVAIDTLTDISEKEFNDLKERKTSGVFMSTPPYQLGFLATTERYPAIVAAVGTGKTRMALQKIWKYCKTNPKAVWIIVRKEYTDLKDSTMPDFEKYFGVKISAARNFHFLNGSRIMFRHGEEVEGGADDPNILKNINLAGFMIEQAEEFKTDKVFTFLRDRLRLENMPYHQGIIVANVKGHNWVWKMWKQLRVQNPVKYPLFEATTFDNAANLPPSFLEDLREMAIDAPSHYRRYVLNDWDEEEGTDVLISRKLIEASFAIEGYATGGKMLVCDPARSITGDESTIAIFQRMTARQYAQTHGEAHRGKDEMAMVGRIMQIVVAASEYATEPQIEVIVIDINGLGGGVYSRLVELKNSGDHAELENVSIVGYNGGLPASNDEKYFNQNAEDCWTMKEMLEASTLRLLDDDIQTDQIATILFDYKSDGRKYVLSKKEMKAKGFNSPDRRDRVMMAMKHLSTLSPEKAMLSPAANAKKEFWAMVNADIERTKDEENGWHNVE